jgi:hypothetical protein
MAAADGFPESDLPGGSNRTTLRLHPNQPEKAEIDIHEADDLYREIRVDNELVGEDGEKAALKPGAEVDVIVEADSDATLKKPPTSEKQ